MAEFWRDLPAPEIAEDDPLPSVYQEDRIKQYGEMERLWYGQSGYCPLLRYPVREWVVVQATIRHIGRNCDVCHQPYTTNYPGTGQSVHVVYLSETELIITHPECSDPTIPMAHDLVREARRHRADEQAQAQAEKRGLAELKDKIQPILF